MRKAVLHHIASDFGKNSSIGFRSKKIYEYAGENFKITVICRSNKSETEYTKNIFTLNLVFIFSRLFGFIKAYLKYDFRSRTYELILFNLLSVPYILIHYFFNINKKKYFHSWDTSLWLIKFVKKLNYKVIKDCAMTPSKSSLIESEKNPFYYIDNKTTKKDIEIEKKIFENSDIIISPSTYTTVFINKEYKINIKKIKTIPFGIEKKFFQSKNYKREIVKKSIKFGFVGLVNMRKGIRWLINDLNLIYENGNKNFELHLFGRIFKEEFKTLERAKFKIISYGFVDISKENVYELFDILIHPSFVEGSAKCIYEAMASGLPVICTEQSGSLVKDKESGFIIKTGDDSELKNAVEFFLMNKNQIIKMGKLSRSIISYYSWELYAKKVSLNY